MLNVMKSEFYRISKLKAPWIALLIVSLLQLLATAVVYLMRPIIENQGGAILYDQMGFLGSLFGFDNANVGIITIIFSVIIITGDFNHNRLKKLCTSCNK